MISGLGFVPLIGVFALAAAVLVMASVQAIRLADLIADRTGLGEAVTGGILLGGATSIAGSVVSITAALDGDASFAISNGVGGIAVQTLFLAFADMAYRKANLEHTAAEATNLFQAVMLVILLSLPLAAISGPEIAYFGVHPMSLILFLTYAFGVRLSANMHARPMWLPTQTADTRRDDPDPAHGPGRSALRPFLVFALLVAILGLCGWIISRVGTELIERFGLESSLVGALVTAVVTSMPELVTTLAAVRRGALQLAVGGIIGGNTFDTLFVVFSDIAYRPGSIYHAIGPRDIYWFTIGLLMTGILLAGLIYRQRHGPARIGLESSLLILVYVGAVVVALLI
jgi:cation:H+ antiporter